MKMKNFVYLFFIFGLFIQGCSSNSTNNKKPALYDTKSEAEKAAKEFNCIGAHKMGDKWMPCQIHKIHQEHKKDHHHSH